MSSYTREAVEVLVPTIWDRTYAWGVTNDYAPDPQMPKTKAAKNQANTLWAHLADIRRAWDGADLTVHEAQALLLCGGMGLTNRLAGAFVGRSKSSVQEAYERGVSRLMDYLNGTDTSGWDEEIDTE